MNIECNTSALNTKDRTEIWCETVRSTYGSITVQPDQRDGENLFGHLTSESRDTMRFNTLRYRGQSHHRTPADIARLSNEYVSLTRPVSGQVHIDYGGKQGVFEPGNLYLYNHAVPYYAKPRGEYVASGIAFPASALRQRGIKLQPMHVIQASSHQGMLVSSLGNQLSANYKDWSDQEFSLLSEQLLDLIALFFRAPKSEHSQEESSVRLAHLQRALAYIRANFGDTNLSPASIAHAGGISVSYLHNLFSVTGTGVESTVISERLEHSKKLLTSSQFMHLPIGTISYMSGFTHQAHFSRAFRQRFGCSPRDFRSGGAGETV
ncbi:helix-turn-helix domain-containing protein [soil metagenome]